MVPPAPLGLVVGGLALLRVQPIRDLRPAVVVLGINGLLEGGSRLLLLGSLLHHRLRLLLGLLGRNRRSRLRRLLLGGCLPN